MFPVLFCLGRAPGWLAHWTEQLKDNEMYHPTHVYVGEERVYTPIEKRGEKEFTTKYTRTQESSNIRKKHCNDG